MTIRRSIGVVAAGRVGGPGAEIGAPRFCVLLAVVLSSAGARAQCNPVWHPAIGNPGMNGEVRALASWDADGPGPLPVRVVAGGSFTTAGGVAANRIAYWNGSAWFPLGSGMNDRVNAVAVLPSGELVAGGWFTTAGGVAAMHIARWNGAAWAPLGSGIDGSVNALVKLPSGNLVAGGGFNTAGGVLARCVAQWNGSAWSPLGPGLSGSVNALAALSNGHVVAAGDGFEVPAGNPGECVALWDGADWVPMGDGFTSWGGFEANALTTLPNDQVIAGGSFGGLLTQTRNVARWNGSAWESLGTYIHGHVYALAALADGQFVAGGEDFVSSAFPSIHILRWNGTGWSLLGPGTSYYVYAMTTLPNGDLIVGGWFDKAGGMAAGNIARWGCPPINPKLAPPSAQLDARFATAVAGATDLDGDGQGDALVGAPYEDMPGGFVDCGRVHVYHGTTGTLNRTINPPNKQPGGLFGYAVAGIDHVIGNPMLGGVLVGAPKQHPGAAPADAGRAYVFDGTSGVLIRAIASPHQQAGGLFGWAVTGVPDLTGDGYTEYLVSAPGETVNGSLRAGRAYLYNGLTGAVLRTFSSPNGEPDGKFGWSVSSVPDATGDGKADILIGAPYEDPGASPVDAGRAYLFNGATGALTRTFVSLAPEAGGRFGWSVSGIASVNGDPRGDVAVGAPGDSPGASPVGCGRAYVYSGANGAWLRTLASPNSQANGAFGSVVVGTADVTGDAHGDVYVSGPGESVSGQAAGGRVYVFRGNSGSLFRTVVSPNNEAGGRFGNAVAVIRDTNANNRQDILVGAPFEDPGSAPGESGRAYVIGN